MGEKKRSMNAGYMPGIGDVQSPDIENYSTAIAFLSSRFPTGETTTFMGRCAGVIARLDWTPAALQKMKRDAIANGERAFRGMT